MSKDKLRRPGDNEVPILNRYKEVEEGTWLFILNCEKKKEEKKRRKKK